MTDRPPRLAGFAAFAAVLAGAGLPIYIHAPAYYAESFGIGLGVLGSVLFALRLIDVVQDPALGWLAAKLPRGPAAAGGMALLGLAMLGLYAVPPPIPPVLWFALTLVVLFSAYSFLTIVFYAQGVTTAGRMGEGGHVRLAAWRETGTLLGVSAAAVAPNLPAGPAPFAIGFAAMAILAWALMRGDWRGNRDADGTDMSPLSGGFRAVLRDPPARRLLLIALANAAPVAVSSTLFLFYVEAVLEAPAAIGPLFLLFFLSAAGAAPLWARLARRIGERAALSIAMVAAMAAFSTVLVLGPGDVVPFGLICIASGATLGADLTLLPALFARRMEKVAPEASGGFALWSFMQKLTLAIAAIAVLPALDRAGFVAGGDNPDSALRLLTLLYGGLPVVLKIAALALLRTVPGGTQAWKDRTESP
ncbi:sugar:cation symporter [Rhodobacterales bacterium HKCCE3408]|nr:sugar:cation symporter [Rhodobacterales bacterium HKCCE3408]